MGWVRVDDAFYDHDKFTEAGPLGVAQWVAGLAWSNRNLKDGFIPFAVAKRLMDWNGIAWQMWAGVEGFGGGGDADGTDISEHLVRCGLWEKMDGGYQIHDYHDFQPSAEEIRERRLHLSAARSEAGRRGGLATQNRRSSKANKQTESDAEASDEPKPEQLLEQSSSPKPNPKPNRTKNPSRPFWDEFVKAWRDYPRKDGREAAYKAYRARRGEGITEEQLALATCLYAKARAGDEPRYTMMGATFFGPNERWKDYLDQTVVPIKPKEDWFKQGVRPGSTAHEQSMHPALVAERIRR